MPKQTKFIKSPAVQRIEPKTPVFQSPDNTTGHYFFREFLREQMHIYIIEAGKENSYRQNYPCVPSTLIPNKTQRYFISTVDAASLEQK